MFVASFIGVKKGKAISAKVFIEDGLDQPLYVKHPSGVILRRRGSFEKTSSKPEKGSLLISAMQKEELEKLAKKQAEEQVANLKEAPEAWENGAELAKLPESHWVSEFKKALSKTGKTTEVK